MTTYRLDLPYTRPPLTENQRLTWAPKARITKQVRATTAWLARAAHIPTVDYCTVTLYWAPSKRRIRDTENPTPTLKACADGIVDAGVVKDDDPQYMGKELPVILEPRTPPAMWLEIITEGQG